MRNKTVYFTGPGQVEIRESEIPAPGPGTVLVKALMSGISSGTELLIYRGQAPQHMAADSTISSLSHSLAYPLPYGYCMVGRVAEAGSGVDPDWLGKKVFAFHHHASYFCTAPENLICIPDDLSIEEAVFLPNMETAVNLLLDGKPLIGESVAVFGQGIVGLLTVSLLALHPLSRLVSFDLHPIRRKASLAAGAHYSWNPSEAELQERIERRLPNAGSRVGFDLAYELSGTPAALDQAVGLTGFDGRILVGSWYGLKRASLDLGSHFHRSRIRLISSQVSTIAPDLLGRWNNARRIDVAWQMIRNIHVSSFLTHSYPIDLAAEAYKTLDGKPDEIIQAVLTYE